MTPSRSLSPPYRYTYSLCASHWRTVRSSSAATARQAAFRCAVFCPPVIPGQDVVDELAHEGGVADSLQLHEQPHGLRRLLALVVTWHLPALDRLPRQGLAILVGRGVGAPGDQLLQRRDGRALAL